MPALANVMNLNISTNFVRGIQLAYKPHAYGDLDWALLMQVDPATLNQTEVTEGLKTEE